MKLFYDLVCRLEKENTLNKNEISKLNGENECLYSKPLVHDNLEYLCLSFGKCDFTKVIWHKKCQDEDGN